MPSEDRPKNVVEQPQECADVYDFLERIRSRPGMWLPGGSLHHLQSMLIGYEAALGVHAIAEPFDLMPGGAFTTWLHERRGTTSSLSWAAAIERDTPEGASPLEEFFRLLDAYRREPLRR